MRTAFGTAAYLGNQDFALSVSDMPPGQAMLVAASFGTATPPFPVGFGCDVYLQPASVVTIPVLRSPVRPAPPAW